MRHAFVVTVPVDEIDIASDRLWQLGVRGIEERGIDDQTVELWTAIGESATAVERATARLDPRWTWALIETDDRWEQTWREHVRPTRISSSLIVVPAWLAAAEAIDRGDVDDDVTVILIEPGETFGLGDHPTTRLVLAVLERSIRPGWSVLDVGCGSGVLSIAARHLGAGSVRAIDIAAAAVEATLSNAQINGADGIDVDTAPLGEIEDPADLVLANLLAPTLIDLAPDLTRLTRRQLVVSGVLAHDHDHVVAAFASMDLQTTQTLDGWAALVFEPR